MFGCVVLVLVGTIDIYIDIDIYRALYVLYISIIDIYRALYVLYISMVGTVNPRTWVMFISVTIEIMMMADVTGVRACARK